jgi:uncharacterized protein YndB with AHSA1/START domain
MWKKILITLAVLIGGVLLLASTKPDDFSVKRSVAIKAPPEKVFALINDFNRWPVWSPWEKLDPAMSRSFSGASSGQGAIYGWKGNSDVGEGRMEILQSTPSSRVVIKLDFISPFEAHNTAEFTLESKTDATAVTWTMVGPMPFASKLMSVFASMDTLVGKDFEAGLANMKTAAEK